MPAAGVDDSSTCAYVAPAGAVPATAIRCHDADAAAVVSDHVMLTSTPAPVSQRIPMRSGTVAPDASANASYRVPAVIG